MSNIFKFKVNIAYSNVACVRFELRRLKWIIVWLEKENISYLVLDPRNEYNVDSRKDFEKSNVYDLNFKGGYSLNKRRNNISKVNKELAYYIDKPNFRKVIKEILEVCANNKVSDIVIKSELQVE